METMKLLSKRKKIFVSMFIVACNKKSAKLALAMLVLISMCVAVNAYLGLNNKDKVVHIEVSKVSLPGTFEDNIKNSDIILVGKVTSSTSYDMHGVPFTDYSIETVKNIKSKKKNLQDIKVSITGGKINGTQYIVDGENPLNIGDTYLLFLDKRYPNDDSNSQYTLVYDNSIVKVNEELSGDKKVFKGDTFNPENPFETKLKEKDVEQELKNILE